MYKQYYKVNKLCGMKFTGDSHACTTVIYCIFEDCKASSNRV